MKVFLTGATGYVGSAIFRKLIEVGHHPVCLVRTKSENQLPGDIPMDQYTLVNGDLHQPDSYIHKMGGCSVIIHLVGIIREIPQKGISFEYVHQEGTRILVDAAKKAGIQRFVHMSALGARENAISAYHRTKFAAEQFVIHSEMAYRIFRPSVIFGPHDGFVNQLAGLVRLPITPVIGNGAYRLQPVSIHTVATSFVQAIDNEGYNEIYEVGGPEKLAFNTILDEIGGAIGKKKVRKLHQPLSLMRPIVSWLEHFPFFPITTAQLTMLIEENICQDESSFYRDFSFKPIYFRQGIREYLQ